MTLVLEHKDVKRRHQRERGEDLVVTGQGIPGCGRRGHVLAGQDDPNDGPENHDGRKEHPRPCQEEGIGVGQGDLAQ